MLKGQGMVGENIYEDCFQLWPKGSWANNREVDEEFL